MLVFKYMSKNSEIYKYVYMFPMISCNFKAIGSGFSKLFFVDSVYFNIRPYIAMSLCGGYVNCCTL